MHIKWICCPTLQTCSQPVYLSVGILFLISSSLSSACTTFGNGAYKGNFTICPSSFRTTDPSHLSVAWETGTNLFVHIFISSVI